jgi:hypothetical protein
VLAKKQGERHQWCGNTAADTDIQKHAHKGKEVRRLAHEHEWIAT